MALSVSPSDLITRIARCIGIYETNRGGDEPAPKESALDTVSGVHASMATIEQATMPYAVDAFDRYSSLRAAASPQLTASEIAAATACCGAVSRLLSAVAAAYAAGTTADAFIAGQQAAIDATALRDVDVQVMFRAVGLKQVIDQLNAQVEANQITLDAAVASISPAQALGLGAGSLKSYIRTPRYWGENGAAWQRKAVDALPSHVIRIVRNKPTGGRPHYFRPQHPVPRVRL